MTSMWSTMALLWTLGARGTAAEALRHAASAVDGGDDSEQNADVQLQQQRKAAKVATKAAAKEYASLQHRLFIVKVLCVVFFLLTIATGAALLNVTNELAKVRAHLAASPQHFTITGSGFDISVGDAAAALGELPRSDEPDPREQRATPTPAAWFPTPAPSPTLLSNVTESDNIASIAGTISEPSMLEPFVPIIGAAPALSVPSLPPTPAPTADPTPAPVACPAKDCSPTPRRSTNFKPATATLEATQTGIDACISLGRYIKCAMANVKAVLEHALELETFPFNFTSGLTGVTAACRDSSTQSTATLVRGAFGLAPSVVYGTPYDADNSAKQSPAQTELLRDVGVDAEKDGKRARSTMRRVEVVESDGYLGKFVDIDNDNDHEYNDEIKSTRNCDCDILRPASDPAHHPIHDSDHDSSHVSGLPDLGLSIAQRLTLMLTSIRLLWRFHPHVDSFF